jgi:4'-phosphopantetheinyl transferase
VNESGNDFRPLRGAEAHVWWAHRRDASSQLEKLLDEVEHERLLGYHRIDDRDRFLLGCALTKLVLAAYLGQEANTIRLSRTCPDCGRPHGKPSVAAPEGAGVEFSISHSGDLVVAAFAVEAPVGIDVERLDNSLQVDQLTRLVLSDSETQALAARPPEERQHDFFTWWTRKEAIAKAAGTGLRLPLPLIVITQPVDSPRLLAWPHHLAPEEVTLFDLGERDGHIASLAVLGTCESLFEFDGSALIAQGGV